MLDRLILWAHTDTQIIIPKMYAVTSVVIMLMPIPCSRYGSLL